jgi:hypothetical protein
MAVGSGVGATVGIRVGEGVDVQFARTRLTAINKAIRVAYVLPLFLIFLSLRRNNYPHESSFYYLIEPRVFSRRDLSP